MKRLAIVFTVLFVFSVSAYAQMGDGMKPEQKGPMGQGMMGGEGKMPMMPMCQQMMKQKMDEGQQMPMMQMCQQMMMGHSTMMQDMMQIMQDMMQMQERMLKEMKAEKKTMNDMAQMKEKMKKMMQEMKGKMKCGMMMNMPPETNKEDQKDAPQKNEPPKSEPQQHKH